MELSNEERHDFMKEIKASSREHRNLMFAKVFFAVAIVGLVSYVLWG